MIPLLVIALGAVICCWIWSDARLPAKCTITALYLATWGFVFIPFHGLYLFPLGQCIVGTVAVVMTVGFEWLTHSNWRWKK